jgi:hypothetical protein
VVVSINTTAPFIDIDPIIYSEMRTSTAFLAHNICINQANTLQLITIWPTALIFMDQMSHLIPSEIREIPDYQMV